MGQSDLRDFQDLGTYALPHRCGHHPRPTPAAHFTCRQQRRWQKSAQPCATGIARTSTHWPNTTRQSRPSREAGRASVRPEIPKGQGQTTHFHRYSPPHVANKPVRLSQPVLSFRFTATAASPAAIPCWHPLVVLLRHPPFVVIPSPPTSHFTKCDVPATPTPSDHSL